MGLIFNRMHWNSTYLLNHLIFFYKDGGIAWFEHFLIHTFANAEYCFRTEFYQYSIKMIFYKVIQFSIYL